MDGAEVTAGGIYDLDAVRGRGRVTDAADVVIVGSGAAGATAARVLAEAGVDVVVIEEGEHVRTEQFTRDAYTSFKHLWRDMGFQVAKGRSFIPLLQGCAVGGTTVINGAIIHRLPEMIHARWEQLGAIDELLSMRELERVYDVMDRELGVVQAPVLGRNNELMRVGVDKLEARGGVTHRAVRSCEGSARCNQGCPGGRKQGMNLTYVPRAVAAGARVYATCKARRILTRRGRAVGVTGRFRRPVGGERGPDLHVTARHAVLIAASAIQTPVLLANNGLGKRTGRLGRRLTGHPGTSVMAVFDQPVDMWFGATQGYETTHFFQEGMKLETVGVPPEIGAARLPGYGTDLVRRIADFGHLTQWGVHIRGVTEGRVRPGLFGGSFVRYDMTRGDVRIVKAGVERLVRAAFDTGAREVYPGVHGLPERLTKPDPIARIHDLPDDPRLFHFIMAHLFGTAQMHPDDRRGEVGPDGQSHELPGLYVLDSSLFPTNMGVNPQHTIGAIAWRVAERIADRLAA